MTSVGHGVIARYAVSHRAASISLANAGQVSGVTLASEASRS